MLAGKQQLSRLLENAINDVLGFCSHGLCVRHIKSYLSFFKAFCCKCGLFFSPLQGVNNWRKTNIEIMKKILFVCHGNICRSPMAEFIMKDLVRKAGREDEFYIESAATSTEEIGNSVYPPARRKLAEHGIDCEGKTARRMGRGDYDRFDLLVGMDEWNIRNMNRIAGGDPERKICKLLDFTNRPGDVADPWYTDDFDATWRDCLEGCDGILNVLENK